MKRQIITYLVKLYPTKYCMVTFMQSKLRFVKNFLPLRSAFVECIEKINNLHFYKLRSLALTGVLFFYVFFVSCATLVNTPKYDFVDGYYHTKVSNSPTRHAYVTVADDTIKVYNATRKALIDTIQDAMLALPSKEAPKAVKAYRFSQRTFDVDVLSVLFKYRPTVNGFPNQFNTTFNGAVYVGYRSDIYKLTYQQTPFGIYKKTINHYGYSIGGFSGFGTARIDEYVTLNRLTYEYDGFVNLTGIAAIIGINKLSVGLTFGEDHLLDKNHSLWVNNAKPWIGLSLGLNLN